MRWIARLRIFNVYCMVPEVIISVTGRVASKNKLYYALFGSIPACSILDNAKNKKMRSFAVCILNERLRMFNKDCGQKSVCKKRNRKQTERGNSMRLEWSYNRLYLYPLYKAMVEGASVRTPLSLSNIRRGIQVCCSVNLGPSGKQLLATQCTAESTNP